MLSLLVSTLASATLPTHITTMSMYGYNATLQAEWTTFGFSRDSSELVAGHALTGLPGLLRLDGGPLLNRTAGVLALASDWQAQLAKILEAARPHLVAGVLRGVMIGDELTAQGLPFASLELLIDKLAATLAGVPATSRTIYYNDSIFAATWPRIPHNLTLFSLDYYHGPATGRIGRTVMDLYNEYVLPKLGPNTRALFVPQAFGSDVGAVSLEQYEEYALGNLSLYVGWASADERIVGFNPWHLLDRPLPANTSECAAATFGCCERGVVSMPRLRAALEALGREIKTNRISVS